MLNRIPYAAKITAAVFVAFGGVAVAGGCFVVLWNAAAFSIAVALFGAAGLGVAALGSIVWHSIVEGQVRADLESRFASRREAPVERFRPALPGDVDRIREDMAELLGEAGHKVSAALHMFRDLETAMGGVAEHLEAVTADRDVKAFEAAKVRDMLTIAHRPRPAVDRLDVPASPLPPVPWAGMRVPEIRRDPPPLRAVAAAVAAAETPQPGSIEDEIREQLDRPARRADVGD